MTTLRMIAKNAGGTEILNCTLSHLPMNETAILARTKELYGPHKCCLTRRTAVETALKEELRLFAMEQMGKEIPFSALPDHLIPFIRGGNEFVTVRFFGL